MTGFDEEQVDDGSDVPSFGLREAGSWAFRDVEAEFCAGRGRRTVTKASAGPILLEDRPRTGGVGTVSPA